MFFIKTTFKVIQPMLIKLTLAKLIYIYIYIC